MVQAEHDDGQNGIERELGGDTPGLPERGDRRVRDIDLQSGAMQQGVAQTGPGHQGHDCQGEPVGRHDTREPASRIPGHRRRARVTVRMIERAIQEKAGQCEEERDPEVTSSEQIAQ